jgi:hypothetical protein
MCPHASKQNPQGWLSRKTAWLVLKDAAEIADENPGG